MKLALAFCFAAFLGSAQSGPQTIAARLFQYSRLGGGDGIIAGVLRHGLLNPTSQSAQNIAKGVQQAGQMAQTAAQVGGQMAGVATSNVVGTIANGAESAAKSVAAATAPVQAATTPVQATNATST